MNTVKKKLKALGALNIQVTPGYKQEENVKNKKAKLINNKSKHKS